MPVEKVLLAEPRGFCAGVEMAIKALAWMVRAFEPPVYCYHEIVHNRLVVERFREQGVIFVDDVADVPAGAPLMLSAHGSAPEVVEAAAAEGRYVVNAVCPLVTKVHHEAKVRARKGFTILYVGHAGHDEAVGTLAVAPEAIRLVEHEDDLDAALAQVADPERVAMLAQTTLAHNEWTGMLDQTRARFPELWTASRNDLCFATTNRQNALTASPREADAVVVIGSANSSNTIALTKVAIDAGCPIVVRVDGPDELDVEGLGDARVVGVTAGASAPEDLVEAVIAQARTHHGVDAGAGDRRGRVLPAAARAARAHPGARRRRRRSRSAAIPNTRASGADPSPTIAASTRPRCSQRSVASRRRSADSSASSNARCKASASCAVNASTSRTGNCARRARRRHQRLPHHDHHATEAREPAPPAAHDLLGARHTDRNDRHVGAQREVGRARLQGLDLRAVLARAFGEDREPVARLQHRHRVAHCLAIGAVACDREPAERSEDRAEHRDLEDLGLAHVSDPLLRHQREERDLHHRSVRRREHVPAGSRQPLLARRCAPGTATPEPLATVHQTMR